MTWRDDASCRGLAQPWHDPWHPEGDVITSAGHTIRPHGAWRKGDV